MTWSYFSNLEEKPQVAEALMLGTANSLGPFRRYLESAIKLMKEKEVSANWERVNSESIQLSPQEQLYRVTPYTKIKILEERGWYRLEPKTPISESFNPDKEILLLKSQKKLSLNNSEIQYCEGHYLVYLPNEEIDLGEVVWSFTVWSSQPAWTERGEINSVSENGRDLRIVSKEQDEITILGNLSPETNLLVNSSPCRFEILGHFDLSSLGKVKLIKEEESALIVASSHKLSSESAQIESEKNLSHYIDLKALHFLSDQKSFDFPLLQKSSLLYQVENARNYLGCQVISSEGIIFFIEEPAKQKEDVFWLRLLEIDDQKEEDAGSSSLDYFFDNDIDIYDDKNYRYEVFRKREDDEGKKLLLKSLETKEFTFPKGERISVRVNIYNLRMQREAIDTLSQMPLPAQRSLIKLFEKRALVRWSLFKGEKVSQWQVLTDDSRSGAEEQREFVRKALATPDFAILEGPPGSGKTTVILELIYQITKKGQRVLLCGSTHVAVDNVLERLEQYGILDQVLPVRIGHEYRIRSEYIRDNFQLEKAVGKHCISEKLLLECSNLVCGTTIGILQHPFFKERNAHTTPASGDFDYLIIDECSKTTFQEFLVPALYAKKWILVGDPRQLSPYTERDHIVASFKHSKKVSPDLQKACFYLHLLNTHSFRAILPCSRSVMLKLEEEIEQRNIDKEIYFIGKLNSLENPYVIEPSDVYRYALDLTAADWIFVDKNYLEEVIDDLPENLLLLDQSWEATQHAYRHNARFSRDYYIRRRKDNINDSAEIIENILSFLREKSWAEELTWRLSRKYELRQTKQNVEYLERAIDELLPASQEMEREIQIVEDITLPSILEGLQQPESSRKGLHGRREQETTLTQGFSKHEKKCRHTILAYQHRMHPEISDLPRELFYTQEDKAALKDAQFPQSMKEARKWSYQEYAHRRVWFSVNGQTIKNFNSDEVRAMQGQLQKFCHWASQNPKQNDESWEVACLTFYRGQEAKIREMLQQFCKQKRKYSQFSKGNVDIRLYTVDKFQGQEADLVFLSMVQTRRDGFLDSPNRLNVAITRARYQLVIFGKHDYFSHKSRSKELSDLASKTFIHDRKRR